jgi:hypothetical protein
MKYLKICIIAISTTIVLYACSKRKCANDIFPLIQSYCPMGPASCTDELVRIEGYLSHYNIYNNKFVLYDNIDQSHKDDICLNTSIIEVYYPSTDLSAIFNKGGGGYTTDSDVKVIVNNARIWLFTRNNPGVDDGNYLQVDSIQ